MTLALSFDPHPDPVTAQIQKARSQIARLSLRELVDLLELIQQGRLFAAPHDLRAIARTVDWLVREDGGRHLQRALWQVRYAIIDRVKGAA